MEIKKMIQDILLILFLAGCCLAVYVVYRYWQTPQGIQIEQLSDMQAFSKLPSSICNFTATGFSGGEKGIAYVDKGSARLTILLVQANASTIFNETIDPDGNEYGWKTGVQPGAEVTPTVMADIPTFQTFTSISCSPWWFPDRSVFVVPDEAALIS